jgi:hypothetical protein
MQIAEDICRGEEMVNMQSNKHGECPYMVLGWHLKDMQVAYKISNGKLLLQ